VFKKKKLLIVVGVVVLVGLAGAYETVLKAAPVTVTPKISGTLVPLTDPFTVNLAGGHYGRIAVSLLVTKAPAPTTDSTGASVIVLPENDAVRAIITNDLTGIKSTRLVDRAPREQLLVKILKDLKKSTDVPVTQVMFTDLAVQ